MPKLIPIEQFQRPARTGMPFSAENPPAKVDLRPWASPPRNQGDEGSCTGFAFAGLREWWETAMTGRPAVTLSPAFIYIEERDREGDPTQDAGANPNDGCIVLETVGAAPESDDPYAAGQFTSEPSAQALRDAPAYRITTWSGLATLDEVKGALANGMPVALGLLVLQGFFETPATGIVPVPLADAAPGDWKALGAHLIACYGYDDTMPCGAYTGALICRNSWGEQWGAQGDVYIPYGYFTDVPIQADPAANLLPTLMGGWLIEAGTLPTPKPAPPAPPAPVPTSIPATVLVDGTPVIGASAEIVKGFAWGELKPIVEAMGWHITRRAVPGGQQILITLRPWGQ